MVFLFRSSLECRCLNSNYHVTAAFHIKAVQQTYFIGVVLMNMHVSRVTRTKEAEQRNESQFTVTLSVFDMQTKMTFDGIEVNDVILVLK